MATYKLQYKSNGAILADLQNICADITAIAFDTDGFPLVTVSAEICDQLKAVKVMNYMFSADSKEPVVQP